jgi:hypothetical protein
MPRSQPPRPKREEAMALLAELKAARRELEWLLDGLRRLLESG